MICLLGRGPASRRKQKFGRFWDGQKANKTAKQSGDIAEMRGKWHSQNIANLNFCAFSPYSVVVRKGNGGNVLFIWQIPNSKSDAITLLANNKERWG
jgi:hypothetical protein